MPTPLASDAPPGLFSEGRALETTSYLADTIGHRQVSTSGEERSSRYLLHQANQIAATAAATRPDLNVTVTEERVYGALGRQIVFGMEIANAYNGLTNVVLRVAPSSTGTASNATTTTSTSVLVNAHYDSTLGSPGASDCASCVGVALEIARTIVANASITLHAPIIFLLNGGEETLMQASHGFMASSPYAQELGAFINLESTGPGGPDVLFQHTGDWTLRAYARVAPHPRGTTVGQDFFDLGVIPADTDYRMFSYRHYGSVPGIDVAFLFDGVAYHTSQDTTARIRRGTVQQMGENMMATALEFARVLKHQDFRGEATASSSSSQHSLDQKEEDDPNKGHVFFDVLSTWMIVYSHQTALVLHQAPLMILLTASLKSSLNKASGRMPGKVPVPGQLLKEAGRGALAVALGVVAPAVCGAAKTLITQSPLAWYSRHLFAYSVFIPASLAGLLAPYARGSVAVTTARATSTSPIARARAASLGLALLFSTFATALTSVGIHSAYIFVSWAIGAWVVGVGLLPKADFLDRRRGFSAINSVLICLGFSIPLVIALPTAMSTAGHVMEKIGLAGSAPGTLGVVIPDAAVGALTGAGCMLALGTLIPYLSVAMGKRAPAGVRLLLALAIFNMAMPSLFAAVGSGVKRGAQWNSTVPYTVEAPKRIIIQHIHRHHFESNDGGSGIATNNNNNKITDSFYSFASLDAIPVDVALNPDILSLPDHPFRKEDWVGLYPINYLVTGVSKRAPVATGVVGGGGVGSKVRGMFGGGGRLPSLRRLQNAQEYYGSSIDGGNSIGVEEGGKGKRGGAYTWFVGWWESVVAWLQRGSSGSIDGLDVDVGDGNTISTTTKEEEEEEIFLNKKKKRWYFELDTVRPGWAVLNITGGDVEAWSLGPEVASTRIPTATTTTTTPTATCHMVRYASGARISKWRFWVETAADARIQIELFVKHLEPISKQLQGMVEGVPVWVSPAAVVTYHSLWQFDT